MPSLRKNLEVANGVMDELKQTSTCSHDIIRRDEMPAFNRDEMDSYVRRFGQAKVTEYASFTARVKVIRTRADALARGTYLPVFVRSLACSQFGVGEAHELANSALYSLIKLGRFDSNTVCIQSAMPTQTPGVRQMHLFVVLGAKNIQSIRDLNSLQSLGQNVLILDPLLGYVGKASDYVNDNRAYLNTFGYLRQSNVVAIGGFSERQAAIFPQIDRDVQRVTDSLHREGIRPYQRERAASVEPIIIGEPIEMPEVMSHLFHLEGSERHHKKVREAFDEVNSTSDSSRRGLYAENRRALETQRFFAEPLSEELKEAIPSFKPTPL